MPLVHADKVGLNINRPGGRHLTAREERHRSSGWELVVHAVIDRTYAAQSGAVSNERGAGIQARLDALSLSDREFERRTGVERKTLRRAIDGGERTRESTWRSIESALDTLEARFRGEPTTAPPPVPLEQLPGDPHMVTIRGTRGGDIDVVVSGPVEDIETLAATVERLLRVSEKDEGKEG